MIKQVDEGVEISLYIQPGASKSDLAGIHNGQIKLKIKAPPVDGKANEAVVEFLSEILGTAKRNIQILKGEKSREKKVLVAGFTVDLVKEKLKL